MVHQEHEWLSIPTRLGCGVTGSGFAMSWSIYRWFDGRNPCDEPIVDL
jgi:hypothetical protein